MSLRYFARVGLNWIFPPVCLLCRAETTQSGLLCGCCFVKLHPIRLSCVKCALPLPAEAFADQFGCCASCADHALIDCCETAYAAFTYDEAARSLIFKLKYADRPEVAQFFAKSMVEGNEAICRQAEIVAPVPLHWRRLWQRRYNQSALLAAQIKKLCPHLFFLPDGLKRVRGTKPLAALTLESRRHVLHNAFSVSRRNEQWLKGKRVLLVDDILTTGTTAAICAKELLAAGADRVDLLTAARTVKRL